MKFIVHHDNDSLVISGNSIEEIQDLAEKEITSRHWKENDCWSEKIK